MIFNMAGYALGWAAGFTARWRVGHLLHRHQGWADADRFTLVLVALWWVAELYPLIPTLDVSSVAQNVKSLWQQDLWQPRRMLTHVGMAVIGLSAVAHLARSAHLAHRARTSALVATVAVLAGKFVVVGQSPGMAVVLGIGGGWLLWRWLDSWAPGHAGGPRHGWPWPPICSTRSGPGLGARHRPTWNGYLLPRRSRPGCSLQSQRALLNACALAQSSGARCATVPCWGA
ncbi:hypothetical protein CBP35_07370 [Acidovorax carolinensis]|nr:hypothetical protein CBP35_07370 [Acidovorax carolinensis]